MQALSSYNPEKHSIVQADLQGLENPPHGLVVARSYFSARGLFARFVWADWPEELAAEWSGRIKAFHAQHPELVPVTAGSPDWEAIFRGWRPDPPSVSAIAGVFCRHFGQRVLWVESERDSRGRVAGHCMVEGIGEITLHLFWRDSTAIPAGPMLEADMEPFQSSVREVFQWASQRIEMVFEALHGKLKELYGERFRGLYVFGSYARPDAGIELPEDSDLDVVLLLSDFESPYREIGRYGHITSGLSLEHGLVISVVPVREVDFKEGRTNFTRVISEYAIPVR